MTSEHEQILEMAYDISENKSIEYAMQFMIDNLIHQSSTPIDEYTAHDKMMEYLISISEKE